MILGSQSFVEVFVDDKSGHRKLCQDIDLEKTHVSFENGSQNDIINLFSQLADTMQINSLIEMSWCHVRRVA